MENKSASQAGFFNPRFLIGIFLVVIGALLALVSAGVFSAPTANIAKALGKYQIITSSTDALVPVGFDCSTVHAKGIDRQENFLAAAIMTACAVAATAFLPAEAWSS